MAAWKARHQLAPPLPAPSLKAARLASHLGQRPRQPFLALAHTILAKDTTFTTKHDSCCAHHPLLVTSGREPSHHGCRKTQCLQRPDLGDYPYVSSTYISPTRTPRKEVTHVHSYPSADLLHIVPFSWTVEGTLIILLSTFRPAECLLGQAQDCWRCPVLP